MIRMIICYVSDGYWTKIMYNIILVQWRRVITVYELRTSMWYGFGGLFWNSLVFEHDNTTILYSDWYNINSSLLLCGAYAMHAIYNPTYVDLGITRKNMTRLKYYTNINHRISFLFQQKLIWHGYSTVFIIFNS